MASSTAPLMAAGVPTVVRTTSDRGMASTPLRTLKPAVPVVPGWFACHPQNGCAAAVGVADSNAGGPGTIVPATTAPTANHAAVAPPSVRDAGWGEPSASGHSQPRLSPLSCGRLQNPSDGVRLVATDTAELTRRRRYRRR